MERIGLWVRGSQQVRTSSPNAIRAAAFAVLGITSLAGCVKSNHTTQNPTPSEGGACGGGTCVLFGGIGGCVNGACAEPQPSAALNAALELVTQTGTKLSGLLPKAEFDRIAARLNGAGSPSEHLNQAQQALATSDMKRTSDETLTALSVLNQIVVDLGGVNPCSPVFGEQVDVAKRATALGDLEVAMLRTAETASLYCRRASASLDCQAVSRAISQFVQLPPQYLVAHGAQIHGYAAAIVPSTGRGGCTPINIPDMHIWTEDVTSGKKRGSVTTNAQGYFQLNGIPAGTYHVCAGGTGYQDTCDPQVTTVGNVTVVMDHVVPVYPKETAVWGTVTLADGKTPCFTYRPAFDTLVQAKVQLLAQRKVVAGPVNGNSLGQYVIPTPFFGGALRVAASCEAAAGSKAAVASPSPLNPYDITVGNRPPTISTLELFANGASARRADPGATLKAVGKASDLDANTLHYKWVDESGRSLSLPDAPQVNWSLLPGGARNTLHLQVSDGRGGYAFTRQSVGAGPNLVYVSGRVFDRATKQPLGSVKVTLDGQATSTNAAGYFSFSKADGARFVLNVQATGYALASRVLRRPGTLIQVPLDRMLTTSVDMKVGGTATFSPDVGKIKRSFSLTLKPGALVDASNAPFTGTAKIYGWPYDLNAENPMPGDMGAVHKGKAVVLGTWGALDVRPTDAATGAPLRMAPGQTSALSLLIQADRQNNAPASIPLYSYDETGGIWRDAGQLTRVGTEYKGALPHFSVFNADNQFQGSACVKVVLDPTTLPRPVVLFAHYDNPNDAPFAHNGTEINDDTPVGILRLFPNKPFHLQVFSLGSPSALLASVAMNSGNALPGNVPLATDGQGNIEPGVPLDQSWAACNDCQGRSPADPHYLPCTVAGPQTVPAESIPTFLLSQGAADNSVAYTAAVQNLGNCDRSTFTGWKNCNHFNQSPTADDPLTLPATEAHAYYFNNGDLKFGRDMHCRSLGNGRIACYVTNYGNVGDDFTGAELHDGERAINSVATVCMEYDPNAANNTNVQFWAYQGQTLSQPDQPLPRPALDAQGPKPMPDMCLACHGGFYDSASHLVRGATFLPFDLTSFIYDDNNIYDNNPASPSFSLNLGDPFTGPRAADAQEQFRRLNNLVAAMNPDALVGNSGLGAAFNTAPVSELLQSWYGSCLGSSPCAFHSSPPVPAVPGNGTPFSGHQGIYTDVVAKVCRTCHVAQNDVFPKTWTSFSQMTTAASLIQQRACATASPLSTFNLSMPHAQVPFLRFWNDGLENTLGSQLPLPGNVCHSP